MGLFDGQRVAVAFCTPNRMVRLPNGQQVVEPVSAEWHRRRMGLAVGTNCNFIEFFEDGKEVGEARTSVATRCLEHTPRPEFLFFLDNDVLPEWDAYVKLFFRLRTHPEADIAAGVYACKGLGEPLVYRGDGAGPFWDWTLGDLLTTEAHGVTGVHMGLTLIRTALFQRMLDAGVAGPDRPFFKTVRETGRSPAGNMQSRTGTEDLYFCQLAREVGLKILVDTSVLAGHYDARTGITWGLPAESPPVRRAKWLGGDRREAKDNCGCVDATAGPDPQCPTCHGTGRTDLKLALDLGAGGTRRQWPGHVTFTTDIRPDAKPDYVQDTLYLNLPGDHFDLTASSHHLEHIGRWDQERAWAEVFRVTKPGGRTEHVVPSLEWAAHKVMAGEMDEHVVNVLYGAQEAHGYERVYNLHYFGYTKALALGLAAQAGFVDVTCEDWREREDLGYNLVIRGRKPAPAEAG